MEKIEKIKDVQEKKAIKELWEKFNCINAPKIHAKFDINNKGYVVGIQLNHRTIKKIPREIEYLPNLKYIWLYGNEITKIQGLGSLSHLRQLNLSRNKIQKIEEIENLTNLEDLYLNSNIIQKIEGLENLSNLKTLLLESNQITKIEGLVNLQKLNSLSLSSNSITKIEGLESLSQLNNLYLKFNKIDKIQGLDKLPKLQILDLSWNPISKLEGLEVLSELQRIILDVENLNEGEQKIFKKGIDDIVEYSKKNKMNELIEQMKKLEKQLDKIGFNRKDFERINNKIDELSKIIQNL